MSRALLVIGVLLGACSVAYTQTPISAPPDPQGTGHIRGRIVATDTGAPLRGARVGAWPVDGQASRETSTDADGRYELAQLPAGVHRVSATLDGYLPTSHGQRLPRRFETGVPVIVEEGQTVEHIDLALPRAGVIVVGVTDPTGEPVAGALVQILRFEYRPDGQRQLTSVPTGIRGPARTDDRGEIRVFGLMPGEYAIAASVSTIVSGSARIASARTEGFPRTYYPGTTNVSEARLVALGTGEERTVELAMVASPLRRITGSVVMSDGRPAAGMDLQLAPREGEDGLVRGAGSVESNGTFAIAGVPAGAYVLQVRQNARPSLDDLRARRVPSPFGGARGEFAAVPITVGGGDDVTGLRIVTGLGTTISGRVVFEGRTARPSDGELRVVALPPGLAGGGFFVLGGSVYDFPPDASVAADGSFRISGASGHVQLDVPAADMVVTSITLDGRDITDEVLDLTGTDAVAGVVVTLTDRLTTVAGQVHTRDGQPVPGSVVIVLPSEAPGGNRVRRVHASRATADGRFEIRRLRPGRYLAAAVEWLDEGHQYAPELQQRLRREARELTVGEGQALTLDLMLTPGL